MYEVNALREGGFKGENLPARQFQFSNIGEVDASMTGFARAARERSERWNRRVTEAARLYGDCLSGREDLYFWKQAMNPTHEVAVKHLSEKYPFLFPPDSGGRRLGTNAALGLRETMSVTDYQALFVDVLDRIYYGFYNAYPIVNKSMVRLHTLRDFRIVSRYLLDGVVTPLTSMDAAAPPPQRALYGPVPQDGATYGPATGTAPIQYQPLLWQAMTSVNWRAFVNDDLGIFKDLANRLAIAANRGISKYITGLFLSSTGLNTSLYAAGYRNLITTTYGAASTNPPLSIQGIQDAMKILAGMRDSGGDPILITGKLICYYGPAYAATAKNLQNMLTSYVQVEGGTSYSTEGFPAQFVQTANWAIQNMEWIMDPYMPIVMSGAAGNIANTAWGIVVDPATQNRPAVELGFLQGFDTPQLYQKVPNTQRVGGGVEPMMGDFYTMDQDMKIVTVFAGKQIDGRSTVASTGAGS